MHATQVESRLTELQPLPGRALNWVDGKWVDAKQRSKSFDPATGEEIGTYADASHENAAAAIEAADGAFRLTDWKDNRKLRAKVLNQIADRFDARRDDLIRILSLENGKVRDEAAFEVDMIPHKFRYWASYMLTSYGRALEVEPGHLSFVTRSAIGVAGVIAPFNSPLVLAVRSLAPALAAGVTTVIKLPGSTAQTNCMFSQVLSEATDLPPGVINVFSESEARGSSLLVESKIVRVISFTGSTKTAKIISAAGAPTLKLFQTELGGKTPMIIFTKTPPMSRASGPRPVKVWLWPPDVIFHFKPSGVKLSPRLMANWIGLGGPVFGTVTSIHNSSPALRTEGSMACSGRKKATGSVSAVTCAPRLMVRWLT
jgi:acyl-CoA reductase-like NAD-dependent aldehyde dehydrogenase